MIPLEKPDSLNKNFKNLKNSDNILNTDISKYQVPSIMLPNVKPKDPSLFLALKGKARHDKPYQILNAVPAKDRLPKNKIPD